MNRIVLIGNGFDLAHGLKTSYADFIDWYWEQWRDKLISCHSPHAHDELCTLSLDLEETRDRKETWHSLLHSHMHSFQSMAGMKFYDYLKSYGIIIKTFTPLLEAIMHDVKHQNWVDIERIYYRLLCESLKENSKVSHIELNKQLKDLTEKLHEYLCDVQKNAIQNFEQNKSIQQKIFEPINLQDIAIKAQEESKLYFQERCKSYHILDLLENYQRIGQHKQWGLEFLRINHDRDHSQYIEQGEQYNFITLPENLLLVNFNYTDIAELYFPKEYQKIITYNHIHGDLAHPQSIIFGYGDEMDKYYKELEELNDNEYLNNIKSIKYLEATNYRNLLAFIESAPYQIYIMGHSCGTSDRTLLNTLFEHKNCVSVKPFYYVKPDGTDNYRELVQNISRNFKNKQSLRDKVVNKKYCEQLI